MQLFLEERKMEMIFGILSHSLHTQVYQMINFKLAIPRVKITMSETHMKTEDELARNPDLKKEDLVELRQWLRIQGHLSSISEEDLTLFLHSCYYDVAKTKDCIEKYYNIRTTTPELFTKRDMELPENQKMLSVLNLAELPVKDPNGYHILFHSLKQTEPSKYIFADAARVYLMMIDICIKHEGPSPGIVLLFDLTGVKFGHLRRLSLSLIRKFLVYLQEGLPVRLKAIHILNVMSIMDYIMSVIKPFLSKELLKLVLTPPYYNIIMNTLRKMKHHVQMKTDLIEEKTDSKMCPRVSLDR
ncbi:alpha-tocopherol transfer protein-like isoform X3 [Periplaneta americana]|uniref:alpha-tocopherol transfer protein-like isoform X3 n=1 Tax=Periplaneta americana TaxID=6978 RepID=UPI0037E76A35